MYGGASGKHGRGGGNPRMSYPPPSAVRPAGRLGPGPRNNNRLSSSSVNLGKPGSAAVGVEEHFSLVHGSNPLAYGMIIRLTPDLVEEIRKVEEKGGNAKIKFDANANNTSENVIDVGGKDFRFTWSREMGGLCDIYEERECGESGDGLLVEASCAWRKLNVQRVLDESTTSQVKMRSVEAQLKHKSRQAIILDHGNPTTKNQLKQLAAAESNPFRNSNKQKNEPPSKKRKFDSSPGGAPSRPLSQKPSLSSPASVKSARSASPLLSTPSRLGGSMSPYGDSKKNNARLDDPRSTQASSKEDKPSSEKESTGKPTHRMHGNMGMGSAKSVDLHSKIVSILSENPKGMTVKALDIVVGDAFPNASKEIELLIGSIATFQPASGRYILKKGTESESSRDQLSEIEGSNQKPHILPRSHQRFSTQEACSDEKNYSEENQEQSRINIQEDNTTVEKEVIVCESDGSGHPGSPNKTDDRAGSSSNSESDSDTETDSSDSRSDSESKSKSLVGSGSSSDTDSDASKNSKEGSDVEVDIISEDGKEKDKLASSGQGLSLSHVPCRTPDGRPSQNSTYDNEEYFAPVSVEVEKILPDEDEDIDIDIDVVSDTPPYNGSDRSQIMRGLSSPIHNKHHEYENCGSTHNVVKEHRKINNTERGFKGKTKRGLDTGNIDENSDRFKQLKPGNLPPHLKSGSKKPEISGHFSPYGMENSLHIDSPSHPLKRCDANDDGLRRSNVSSEGQLGQLSNIQPPSAVPVDHNGIENVSNSASKRNAWDNVGHASENSDRLNRGFPSQYYNLYGDTQIEDLGIRNNYSLSSDSQSSKPELAMKNTGAQQVSKQTFGSPPKDDERYPFINGQSKKLRRELSELELGELREHVPEEPLGVKKKIEREGSFKRITSKQGMSDNQTQDPSKPTAVSTEPLDPGKVLSPTSHSKASKNVEVPLKKRDTDKKKRPKQRTANPQTQNELDIDQISTEKKIPTSITKHGDKMKQVSQANAKTSADMIEVNNAHFPEQKRRESSSDENSFSYAKYEKDEPDLWGPIKDFAQYEEYVKEYNSKYGVYYSVSKILESYRSKFLILGKELENAKGKDEETYNKALNRLLESYRQSGEKHKRMKKIFLVLHEELKQVKKMIKDFAAAYTKD